MKRKSWQEISESAEYQAKSEYDKIVAQWKFVRESPEYEAMSLYDKQLVQIEFSKKLEGAEKIHAEKLQIGRVINLPVYDDG